MAWRPQARLSTSQRAGIVAAATAVPLSLAPLLKPRSAFDQGLITGLSTATTYAMTTVVHDVALASAGALRLFGSRPDGRTTAGGTLAVDLAALVVGTAVQLALPWREHERAARALARTAGSRLSVAAVSGAVATSLDFLPGSAGTSSGLGWALRSVPTMVAAGSGIAVGAHLLRIRRVRNAQPVAPAAQVDAPAAQVDAPEHLPDHPPILTSLGVGAMAATGAALIAECERTLARAADRGIRRVTPTGLGSAASHLASLAVLSTGLYAVGTRVYRRIEQAGAAPHPALTSPPTSALVSGSAPSAVGWSTLSREPRRHLSAAGTAAGIAAVMGEPARDPIRIYVGLTSAPTIAGRVELALAELARTRALDRSLLVLCSPTGTGYLNHTAVSAWEHLARGDCATLTMQYSLRPSPMSMDRVDDGREQNRALWLAVADELRLRAPGDRPRVVVFGESLGAHTSQDPFLHTGTRGLHGAQVERALWLGTPYVSGWAQEVRDPSRPDVRPGEVLRVTSADHLDRLVRDQPERAAAARYVLLSHDDDGVALFCPELLYRSPAWLGAHRPAAVPPHAAWSTPITFLQTAVEMRNSTRAVPGEFVASGHDYRADIARAVGFAFDLPSSREQLAAVEAALRREERAHAELWG